MRSKIQPWSLEYQLLRYYVNFIHWLFYDKIIVKGLENIPKNEPVVFAINHQNAIMDALSVVCTVSKQPVFMARADVFKNKWAAMLYKMLKIMPIYRQRDGLQNLQKNTESFEQAFDILKEYGALAIMPEGTHNGKHQLQPLMKGICRIVFSFREKFPNCTAPVIIPVGIHYSNYFSFRSTIVVQYGQGIHTDKYSQLYHEDATKAINNLKNHLANEMKKLIVHIDCGEFYDDVCTLSESVAPMLVTRLSNSTGKNINKFEAQKWFADKCNLLYQSNHEKLAELCNKESEFKNELKKSKLSIESFNSISHKWYQIVFKIILVTSVSLFIAPGLLIYLFIAGASSILTKRIDDKQFHSSIKFCVKFIALPVWVIVILFLLKLVCINILIKIVILIVIIFSGELSFWYVGQIKIIRDELCYLKAMKTRDFLMDLFQKKLNLADETVINPYI